MAFPPLLWHFDPTMAPAPIATPSRVFDAPIQPAALRCGLHLGKITLLMRCGCRGPGFSPSPHPPADLSSCGRVDVGGCSFVFLTEVNTVRCPAGVPVPEQRHRRGTAHTCSPINHPQHCRPNLFDLRLNKRPMIYCSITYLVECFQTACPHSCPLLSGFYVLYLVFTVGPSCRTCPPPPPLCSQQPVL